MLPMISRLVCLVLLVIPGLYAQEGVPGAPVLPPAEIEGPLFVADFSNDAVYRLEDLNADGDANDEGEITVFYDTSAADETLHLATPRYMAVGIDGAVYVGDANLDAILRLEDQDGDGTANQDGEASIYYDAASGGAGLISVSNIAFDDQGFLYLSDTGTSAATVRHVSRIRDENGDGYCSEDDGEVVVLYESSTTTGTVIERPSGILVENNGTLLISDFDSDNIYRFSEDPLDSDGDFDDDGEQSEFFVSDPDELDAYLGFAESLALGYENADGLRPIFVNAGPANDVVYRMLDADSDGDIENPGEVVEFWTSDQADGLGPANTRTLVFHPDGTLFVIEAGQSSVDVPARIMGLVDGNDDGDVNDAGEVFIFADDTNDSEIEFGQLQGMVFARAASRARFVRGDVDGNGTYFPLVDALYLLDNGFNNGDDPPCERAADADNDGEIFPLLDALFILQHGFTNGETPAAPHPGCGIDLEFDSELSCEDDGGCS